MKQLILVALMCMGMTLTGCQEDVPPVAIQPTVETQVTTEETEENVATNDVVVNQEEQLEVEVVEIPNSSAIISDAEAKNIAMQHAGVTEAEVEFVKCKLDYDDGIQEYEVEIYAGDMEYDYEIDATTGDIIVYAHKMLTQRPPTTDGNTTANTESVIADTEAIGIALEHAGLTESQVSRLKCELDYDDGMTQYEIEFEVGNIEYEYEINATTGAIVSFEQDT